jgi:hypothetical protein
MRKYTIMAEYLDHKVRLMESSKDYVVATEDNKYLLNEIGDRLLEDGLIISYQILELIGQPVTLEKTNEH